MKIIIKSLLAAAAGLLLQIPASAQSGSDDIEYKNIVDSIRVFKDVAGPDANDEYLITMSTFVTGSGSSFEGGRQPIDFAIIMDFSGSMGKAISSKANDWDPIDPATDGKMVFLHKKTSVSYASTWKEYPKWSHPVFSPYPDNSTWKDNPNWSLYYYKHTDGKYYPLYKGHYSYASGSKNVYFIFYSVNSTRYFIGKQNGVYTSVTGSDNTNPVSSSTSGTTKINKLNFINGFYSTSQSTVIYDGPLYSASRFSALTDAVRSFLETVKADDAANFTGKDYHHRVGLVKFADDEKATVGNDFYTGDVGSVQCNYSQILCQLSNINSNYDAMVNIMDNVKPSWGTRTDYGMSRCKALLADSNSTHRKVVIVFTDGDPSDPHKSNFDEGFANGAINYAKQIKASGAEVYVVATGLTGTNAELFCDHLSSNYPNAIKYNDNSTKNPDGNYFKLVENGAELEEVFTSIASSNLKAKVGYNLNKDNSMVFDALTNYFLLPDDYTLRDNYGISVGTRDLVSIIGNSYNFSSQFVPLNPTEDYHLEIRGENNREIVVSGFDFAENWVGYENVTTIGGTKERRAHGKELVVLIPIVVDPANPGGVSVETNDPRSGVYCLDDQEKPIVPFPIPTLNRPNIVIIKNGLKEKDSAIFKISRLNDDGSEDATYEPFVVMETADASGTAKARIKLVDEGRYKVTEEPWSWAYTTIPETSYAEDDGKTSGSGNYIIRNVNGTTANAAANATLYIFNNEPKKNMPAHDEDVVNNVFFTPDSVVHIVE